MKKKIKSQQENKEYSEIKQNDGHFAYVKKIAQKEKTVKFNNLWLYFVLISLAVLLVTEVVASVLSWLLSSLWRIEVQFSIYGWIVLFGIIIGCIMSVIIGKIFFVPMTKLSGAMKQVAKGDFSVRLEEESSVSELKAILANFNLMVKELGATEILQSDFVSNVSHEFKTPISVIEGYAALLQDETLTDEERKSYTEKILLNIRRLSELVGNILLLSKVDNQAIFDKRNIFRLDEQIRQTLVLLEPKWSAKQINLDVSLQEIECEGNEALLQHVWFNLIDNAIKFDNEGGTVKIVLTHEDNHNVCIVEDDGPGITEEGKKHIYDKFYQCDSSRKSEGNGLGLALVKKILDICGGTISCENASEKGTRFTVTLP